MKHNCSRCGQTITPNPQGSPQKYCQECTHYMKGKGYYQKNQEKCYQSTQNWITKNRDRLNTWRRKYYIQNREKILYQNAQSRKRKNKE